MIEDTEQIMDHVVSYLKTKTVVNLDDVAQNIHLYFGRVFPEETEQDFKNACETILLCLMAENALTISKNSSQFIQTLQDHCHYYDPYIAMALTECETALDTIELKVVHEIIDDKPMLSVKHFH